MPTETRIHLNGVELALFEWPGEGRPLFFAHATGFHARCWDQVIARLPGRHCYAMDMRGHGRSAKPRPPYPWRQFGDDVTGFVREFGVREAIGIGHSKGGHAIAQAAAREPGAFAALLLVDPVIMPRSAYGNPRLEQNHFAARRRNEFASPREMFDRFRERPPFSLWDEQVLRDYCEYGLLPNPNGEGYVLACPPEIEAAVYAGSTSGDIYDEIETIDIPVRILRARARQESGAIDMSSSPTNPDLVKHFRRGEDVSLPQYTHFIPMEDPGFVAEQVLDLERKLDGSK